jgi:hypothetical protein
MTRDDKPRATSANWSRAYRALLIVLPHPLRIRNGRAMTALFERELERGEQVGARVVWRTAVAGLFDLVCRGLYERVADERRSLTAENIAVLGTVARAFLTTAVLLTTLLLLKIGVAKGSVASPGTLLNLVLLSTPFTAALTIPMSAFVAVLWTATRYPSPRRTASTEAESHHSGGALRIVPLVGGASIVALGCLVLNAELVPRANLQLQSVYAGRADLPPTDRSMTLQQLVTAQAALASQRPSLPNANTVSIASYGVEIHKKFALAAACVVLVCFAVRVARWVPRAGVAMQTGVSLGVFAFYYVSLIVGEHLADGEVIGPAVAMWSANAVLLIAAVVPNRARRTHARA